jgi:large subunit ribosomal protein L9
MKVLLKQDVEKLGHKGDIVEVAPGFGRNYLIPRRLAVEVTPQNIKQIELERKALLKKIEKEKLSARELMDRLNQVRLVFRRKAGEKDMIFGSVSAGDIKEELEKLGFSLEKKKILLDEPLRRLGHYTIPIKVYREEKAEIHVEIVREEAEAKS